jgi:hypothetical protein
MPAIELASVWRAAKPTTRPSSAEEARIPVATRWTDGNWLSANAPPITRIVTKTSRRTSRSRVSAIGDKSPPAIRVAARWACRLSSLLTISAIANVVTTMTSAVSPSSYLT